MNERERIAAMLRGAADLLDLKENWDGYGALPIDLRAIKAAVHTGIVLAPTPHVSPLNDGGVCLDCDSDDVWFNPDGSVLVE